MAKASRKGRGPNEPRLEVFELQRKLNVLYRAGLKLGVVAKRFTNNSLCKELNEGEETTVLHPTTLYQRTQRESSNPDNPKDAGNEELSIRALEAIGKLFKFPAVRKPMPDGSWVLPWDEWIAPPDWKGSERPDTAGKFEARYVKEHTRVTPVAASINEPVTENERMTSEPLREGETRNIVEYIPGLASIKLCAGNTGDGETVLSAQIDCNEAEFEVSVLLAALRTAIVSVSCGRASAREDSVSGRKEKDGFVVNGSQGKVHWFWCGNTSVLRWRLRGDGARIGSFSVDLAKITQLAHGDVLRGSISVWLKFIEPTSQQPLPNSVTLVDPETHEVQGEFREELSVEQQRVIEHLRKMVLKTNDSNFGELSSHEIQFVRR